MNNNYFTTMKNQLWNKVECAEILRQEDIITWAAQQYELLQDDVQAMAAFVTVLNHKCWYWYDKEEAELSQIYSDLYYKYNNLEWDWLEAHGTSEEKSWYFDTLD